MADGIVVASLDRLARTLIVQEGILSRVWALGGRVFSTDTGGIMRDDRDDPMRTALRHMMGVFAQLERSIIAARLRAGRRQKHLNGGYAHGAPPYGYRAEGRALVPVPEEQRVIARMREVRTQRLSLRAIAAQLDLEGLRLRKAAQWDSSSIGRILARAEEGIAA